MLYAHRFQAAALPVMGFCSRWPYCYQTWPLKGGRLVSLDWKHLRLVKRAWQAPNNYRQGLLPRLQPTQALLLHSPSAASHWAKQAGYADKEPGSHLDVNLDYLAKSSRSIILFKLLFLPHVLYPSNGEGLHSRYILKGKQIRFLLL